LNESNNLKHWSLKYDVLKRHNINQALFLLFDEIWNNLPFEERKDFFQNTKIVPNKRNKFTYRLNFRLNGLFEFGKFLNNLNLSKEFYLTVNFNFSFKSGKNNNDKFLKNLLKNIPFFWK
jgi:hypothetical protein